MKARPIIMSAHQVRGILDGRVTQTRRVVKPQPAFGCRYAINGAGARALHLSDVPGREFVPPTARSLDHHLTCPFGTVGDTLWVRETWCPRSNGLLRMETIQRPFYRASADAKPTFWPWRPSIHMPRWASRITLEILDVRVERIQEITDNDAKAEGARWFEDIPVGGIGTGSQARWSCGDPPSTDHCLGTARYAFANAYNALNGPDAWTNNLWVWALAFKCVGGRS